MVLASEFNICFYSRIVLFKKNQFDATKAKGVNLKSVKNSSLIPGYFTVTHVKMKIVNNTDCKQFVKEK
jgi:hypothetical protein